MNKRTAPKLSVNRDTLRELVTSDLALAGGGARELYETQTCESRCQCPSRGQQGCGY